MADTNAKVANSYEDQEEGYRNDDMAGGDTEDGKNSQTDQKDGRRGGRRFNYRRRRRRTSSDEPTGPVEPIILGVGELYIYFIHACARAHTPFLKITYYIGIGNIYLIVVNIGVNMN